MTQIEGHPPAAAAAGPTGTSPGTSSGVSVERVALNRFRCHRRLKLETGPGTVVLMGRNVVGKTSILEALSLLSPGRGMKRARLEDLPYRSGNDEDGDGGGPDDPGRGWAVAVRLRTSFGPVDVATGRATTPGGAERRQVRINGEPARAQAALSEVARVLWLIPEMDRLFLDGASSRRRFLDRLVLAFDPAHGRRLSAYERALAERARLLRDAGGDRHWLDVLEDTMARNGVAVAAARRDVARRLTGAAAAVRPFPAPSIEVRGELERWLADGPAIEAEERLRVGLSAARRADAESGGAGVGPHRADMVVHHAGIGRLARACSTGEQKALLIALVLASARLLRDDHGIAPLMLLDEVAAHLDPWHRGALFEAAASVGGQTWYAGTDRSAFVPLTGRAQFVVVGEAPNAAPTPACPAA